MLPAALRKGFGSLQSAYETEKEMPHTAADVTIEGWFCLMNYYRHTYFVKKVHRKVKKNVFKVHFIKVPIMSFLALSFKISITALNFRRRKKP